MMRSITWLQRPSLRLLHSQVITQTRSITHLIITPTISITTLRNTTHPIIMAKHDIT